MSKSKSDIPEKKRKRDAEVAEDAPKKSKKSKKTEDVQDAPAVDATEVKKEKKDKKDKKSKKSKDNVDTSAVEDALADAKKDKKEKKSKKSKKSKDADTAEDAPADEAELIDEMKTSENFINVNDDEPMPDSTEDAPAKKDKKDKKTKESKKSKKSKDAATSDDTPMEDAAGGAEEQTGTSEDTPAETNGVDADSKAAKKEKKKEKKEKKEKKSKKAAKAETSDEVSTEEEPAAKINGEAAAESAEADGEEGEGTTEDRFIVFVGNLPYSATKEQLEKHFEKLNPIDIRMRTYKGNTKAKFMGTCFVEFSSYKDMEVCLKEYNHSVFHDAKKKIDRKINVELSAGGAELVPSKNDNPIMVAKDDKSHDEPAPSAVKKVEVELSDRQKKKIARKEAKLQNKDTEAAEAPAEKVEKVEKEEKVEKKDKKEKKVEKKEKKEEKKEEEKKEEEKATEPELFGMNPARLAMMSKPEQPTFPTHRRRY